MIGGDPRGQGIAGGVISLGRELQARGIDIAISELIDASEAATEIDLGSRTQLREALRATLIKQPRHNAEFEAAFDRLFPAHPGRTRTERGEPVAADAAAEALVSGEDLGGVAADLVSTHAGIGEGEQRSERHHMQRVLRGADLARMMSEARQIDPALPPAELRARIEELKRLMLAEIRAELGPAPEQADDSDIQDLDFLNASRVELEAMRLAIRPLARKLAGRLARRRQSRHGGRVHIRRTTRRSLSTGGVPLDVVFQRVRPQKPELFVLCDISGSVADFSLFTLTLMSALSAELARTRCFVFVDAIDEISELLADTEHGIEPWQILRNTNVIGNDGHSDYGAVLTQFWEEVGRTDLKPNSTVLVTGDARTNYHDTAAPVLDQIGRRSRGVYWLNPEPRADWDTHDSEIGSYAPACKQVFEVRNLRQLMSCVEQIL